ncbi:hypothetical protein V5O48_017301 [Marasmius crinis-equi]|uniref:trans-L-3-hydroxyproline dehydratase n=1 Tax=Marasmius crinis-equi TaxID=585013 RepID=A0ABR3EPD1_9AGAR
MVDSYERLMFEPRGHDGMYGAILVQETELTRSGEADIGVLFCHNEGYSTMCGHATVALDRFLVDTHDENVFPARKSLPYSSETGMTLLRLHAPCGIVRISVPTTPNGKRANGTRPVRFVSVPSFVSQRSVNVRISGGGWNAIRSSMERDLKGGWSIPVSIAYGGAFYAIVSARELGFTSLSADNLSELEEAARCIVLQVEACNDYTTLVHHPKEKDMDFLYGVIITDRSKEDEDVRRETGLCFFAGSQIDRSPTGSGVCARVALAVEEGRLGMDEWWTYESLWSRKSEGDGFRARAVKCLEDGNVLVELEGRAFYTGASSFVAPEPSDILGRGFSLS